MTILRKLSLKWSNIANRTILLKLVAAFLFLAVVIALLVTTNFTAQPFAESIPLADPDSPHASEEPIRPIPVRIALDEAKVSLGERLFHDPRLSHDNTASCA